MGKRTPPKNDAQLELFSAIFTDVITRDTRETMEVPFLSLSKRPRFKPIQYKSNGVEVTVSGGEPYGIANIWDWDLIMWLLSQIRHSIDKGEEVSRKIRFHRYSFLKDARRSMGGAQYKRLEESIARLKNTNVVTTIRAKRSRTVMFSWLEYAEIERDQKGNLTEAIVVIPEWLYEAICNKNLVLTLNRDYFLLTGGLERWLYRFIRKQAGHNPQGWTWKIRTLYKRSGSSQRYSDFNRDIRKIIGNGPLLDYKLHQFIKNNELYVQAQRQKKTDDSNMEVIEEKHPVSFLSLHSSTYEKAKKIAPVHDIYALEANWRKATAKNNIQLKDPDSAFLAWCKKISKTSLII